MSLRELLCKLPSYFIALFRCRAITNPTLEMRASTIRHKEVLSQTAFGDKFIGPHLAPHLTHSGATLALAY
jgi:hypothetical protein